MIQMHPFGLATPLQRPCHVWRIVGRNRFRIERSSHFLRFSFRTAFESSNQFQARQAICQKQSFHPLKALIKRSLRPRLLLDPKKIRTATGGLGHLRCWTLQDNLTQKNNTELSCDATRGIFMSSKSFPLCELLSRGCRWIIEPSLKALQKHSIPAGIAHCSAVWYRSSTIYFKRGRCKKSTGLTWRISTTAELAPGVLAFQLEMCGEMFFLFQKNLIFSTCLLFWPCVQLP